MGEEDHLGHPECELPGKIAVRQLEVCFGVFQRRLMISENIDAADIEPTLTWGISPDHGIAISGVIPDPELAQSAAERATIEEALELTGGELQSVRLRQLHSNPGN